MHRAMEEDSLTTRYDDVTIVFSDIEICVDYGGVYVFHVYFDLCIGYGVGVCVGVCDNVCVVVGAVVCVVVCVVVCGLFLASGCYLLSCDVV